MPANYIGTKIKKPRIESFRSRLMLTVIRNFRLICYIFRPAYRWRQPITARSRDSY